MAQKVNQLDHRYEELAVDQIRCYEKNPRVIQNPEYARLKDSLLQNGIEMPLVVTQEPGSSNYVLHAGGNTRLAIAKALHESDTDQFATVPCIVKNWQSELHVLVAHLRENDVRGHLMFIERAIGVMTFAQLLSLESKEVVSQRVLAQRLGELGYGLSQPVISAMDYAVNRLYGLLPTALQHGLGKKQVGLIRALENSSTKVWDQACPDDVGAFPELFSELCKACDGPVFELEGLTANIVHEISTASDFDSNTVQLMIDSERAGESLLLGPVDPIVVDTTRKTDEPSEPRELNIDRSLQRLRSKSVEACVALSEAFGLSEYVDITLDKGLGYFMCEIPSKNATLLQRAVWKFLATACDQCRAPKRVLLRLLNPASNYAKKLQHTRPKAVYAELPPLDVFDLGNRLLCTLDDTAWQNLMGLLSSYRSMKKLADEHSIELWGDAV